LIPYEVKTVKTKAFAIRLTLQMPENWAKCRPTSGRSTSTLALFGQENGIFRCVFNSMRRLLVLVCILGMPCVAFAQNNQTSWENLNALQSGQRIQLVEMSAKKYSGIFVNVSDTAITMQVNGGPQTIQRQDVGGVKLMENKHRLRNTIIGGVVGAGAGAGIAAASWENHGYLGNRGTGAAVGAAFGFVGGAIIGAVLPSHKTIYRAKAP
jgi:hypothetical protein